MVHDARAINTLRQTAEASGSSACRSLKQIRLQPIAGRLGGCRRGARSGMRRRRYWCSRAIVRSTTHRFVPSPEPCPLFGHAIFAWMWRRRSSLRPLRELSARSPYNRRGRRRGRPRRPRTGGITSSSKSWERALDRRFEEWARAIGLERRGSVGGEEMFCDLATRPPRPWS